MKCPKCGYDNKDDANCCDLCKEVLGASAVRTGAVPAFTRPTWKKTAEKTAPVISEGLSGKAAMSYGWNTFWDHIGVFVSSGILIGILSIAGKMVEKMADSFFGILIMVLFYYVNFAMGLGLAKICLDIVDGEDATFNDLFSQFNRSLPYAIATVLIMLIVATSIGLSTFGIIALGKMVGMQPFVYFLMFLLVVVVVAIILVFSLRFFFISYLIVDTDIDAFSSIKESYRLTEGTLPELSNFLMLMFLVNLAGLLCLGIGLLATIPASRIATAHFYRQLKNRADRSA